MRIGLRVCYKNLCPLPNICRREKMLDSRYSFGTAGLSYFLTKPRHKTTYLNKSPTYAIKMAKHINRHNPVHVCPHSIPTDSPISHCEENERASG